MLVDDNVFFEGSLKVEGTALAEVFSDEQVKELEGLVFERSAKLMKLKAASPVGLGAVKVAANGAQVAVNGAVGALDVVTDAAAAAADAAPPAAAS